MIVDQSLGLDMNKGQIVDQSIGLLEQKTLSRFPKPYLRLHFFHLFRGDNQCFFVAEPLQFEKLLPEIVEENRIPVTDIYQT